ncbi:MAG: hypothetical protein ABIN80_23875 [Dyadobacter sp.]|uniref:hypothetical protein n=1 Tax=Dyadobacter sp. TaxID=1914288 RepID=UPI00326512CD
MKTPSFSIWSLGLILWLLIISCVDHEEPNPDRLRVAKLTRVLPDAPTDSIVSLFLYNQIGKVGSLLTSVKWGAPGSPSEQSEYQYDGQGRLSQMKRTLSTGGSELYLYTYDGWGKLTFIKYTGGGNDFYDFVLTYDGSGQLLSTRRSFSISGIKYEQANALTFGMDNVSSVSSVTKLERNITTTSTVTTDFGYDNHTNPFYGLFLIPAPEKIPMPSSGNFNLYTYYGGVNNLLHLSKNNLSSANVKGASQTLYEYTYNASGLPTIRKTWVKFTLEQPPVLKETLIYEYETY